MFNLQGQRNFTQDEILSGQWAKISEYGKALLITFNASGTFRERNLFDEQDPGIQGRWELMSGMLRLITVWEGKQFVLVVAASRTGNMHSGLENESMRYKLIHL